MDVVCLLVWGWFVHWLTADHLETILSACTFGWLVGGWLAAIYFSVPISLILSPKRVSRISMNLTACGDEKTASTSRTSKPSGCLHVCVCICTANIIPAKQQARSQALPHSHHTHPPSKSASQPE
jgi:hypothetical protein